MIMWVIPRQFVGEDLFSGKFNGMVSIHCEQDKMVGQISHEANFDNCELMLYHLVLFTSY